jgi:hypothetical protein
LMMAWVPVKAVSPAESLNRNHQLPVINGTLVGNSIVQQDYSDHAMGLPCVQRPFL